MRGNKRVTFSELFRDTVQTHGVAWAAKHYRKGGMQVWEFLHWMRATGCGVAA